MKTDSKENWALEKPASPRSAYVACEGRQAFPENSHRESALLRLAQLADEFDAEQIAADARSVVERVSEGRFYVPCIGQFKLGKSSVLNALVGDNILPTGVVPVTTVPSSSATEAMWPLACALKPPAAGQVFP
jgi:ribosome biogenesis GTPase A